MKIILDTFHGMSYSYPASYKKQNIESNKTMYNNNLISETIEKLGWNDIKVAAEAGVHFDTVKAIRLGKNVNYETLESVAKAIGLEIKLINQTESALAQ